MLQLLFSLGGFFVGGGAVYIYAKATHQTIEWRGVPGIGYLCRHFGTKTAERRVNPY